MSSQTARMLGDCSTERKAATDGLTGKLMAGRLRKPLSPALSPLVPRGERENEVAQISSQLANMLSYCSADKTAKCYPLRPSRLCGYIPARQCFFCRAL